MAKLIDGKAIAEKTRVELAAEVASLEFTPRLDVILVGENPASKLYANSIACMKCGITSVKHYLPEDTTQAELIALIQELNSDSDVDGVLVHLPLPKHLSEQVVINTIDPAKDVDGLTSLNLGRTFSGLPGLRPCTPMGIIAMLDSINYDYIGKRAVVVGRSKFVGKPLAIMLTERDCTVTLCHSKTKELSSETKRAELLVVAVGKPGFVTADMVSEGVVVIDVGMNKVGSKLVGDVDYTGVSAKAAAITSVPGGVGLMAVAMLMKNTLQAAKERRK